MKNYLYILSLLLLIISCKDSTKDIKSTTISSANENIKEEIYTNPIQDRESENAAFKSLKKITPLSSEELLSFLPEVINGNKMKNKYAYPGSGQMATGGYGPLNSQYNFSIEDGAGSKAIVKNFFNTYSQNLIGSKGNEYLYKERDGYKTIAFLQPKISRNQISLIYDYRFRITLEGPDDVDALWSYIDFENLKKLDKYK